jgi:hypothetical protein
MSSARVSVRSRFISKIREAKKQSAYKLQDFVRSFNQSTEIINQKEIRVIGLRRSGNHAIINWICKQSTGAIKHLNNVPVNYNPYRFLYEHFPKEKLRQESLGNFARKDLLIQSYEDKSLRDITNSRFEEKHDLYLGKSLKRYDLLILRDPFNCFASRLKMFEKKQVSLNASMNFLVSEEAVGLWISYAKEFLGETNYLKNNKICVNYNSWCDDIEYRKKLANKLDIIFSDLEFSRVRGYGGGSSFDGLTMKQSGENTKVHRRWEQMKNNSFFQGLIKRVDLLEYSRKIFGESLVENIEQSFF